MDCWALQVRNPFSYTGNRVVKQVGATMAYLCVVASYITSSIPMSKKHMVMSLMRVKTIKSIDIHNATERSGGCCTCSGGRWLRTVRGWGHWDGANQRFPLIA